MASGFELPRLERNAGVPGRSRADEISLPARPLRARLRQRSARTVSDPDLLRGARRIARQVYDADQLTDAGSQGAPLSQG
jgi:hypothetical protein